MKAKFFTLVLLVLVCAVTASAQRSLLSKTVTGVNATSSVVANVSLDQGFLLWGSIHANAGETPSSVVAVSTGAAGSFSGSIDSSQNYRILLPAGTYNLTVSFSAGSATFTYTDSTVPAPFTVSSDMMRNISLPTVTTSAVTGMVSNLNVLFASQGLTFDSTAISGFSDVTASATIVGGSYSAQLPNGMFNVQLSQTMASFIPPSTISDSILSSNLGLFAVSGGTLNFTAPTIPTATLSGTASITGSASIPASTFLSGLDNSGAPLPTTASSGFAIVPTSGAYSFTFGTGRAYALSPTIPVQLLPSGPLGSYAPTAIGTSGALTTNTVLNPTYPALPGTSTGFTISGRVTITGTSTPVANASLTAFGNQLTGAANTSYGRGTTTDANGNYSLVVPSGTNYTLLISGGFSTSSDFDDDGKADDAVWRSSNGTWYVRPSSNPNTATVQQWGTSGDMPVRGDFDHDGKTDFGVFRPSNGTWYIIPSGSPNSPIFQQWGTSGDILVPGDYDGDGKTDFAVFRPSNGTWYIIPSNSPGSPIIQQWGTSGDIPVPGDYDGDGKIDLGVFRPSNGTWYLIPSSSPGSPVIKQWGTGGDMPVPGDYDGDGKTDMGVFRPSNGTWYIIPSSTPGSPTIQQWGTSGDTPVPSDYDGDRKTDIAVWRSSNGVWYVIPSSAPLTSTVTQWGTVGDAPIEKPIGQ